MRKVEEKKTISNNEKSTWENKMVTVRKVTVWISLLMF